MTDWHPVSPPVLLSPSERWGKGTPVASTPEERYEALVGKLPKAARFFAPGTLGEAGFTAGAGATALSALLAPETAGVSLAFPLIGAMAGGAIENPREPFTGASWETLKALLQEGGGGAFTKGMELLGRWLGKPGILARTAQRIADSVPSVFHQYPLSVPRTAEDLRAQLGGGEVSVAAGRRLGMLRDALDKRFGKYVPAKSPVLVPASAGQPYHYTAGQAASGRMFVVPDLDVQGNVIIRQMGIKEAIDHTREMFAASRTAGGVQKTIASAPKMLETAVQARDLLTKQLNAIERGLGDTYRGYSTDYAIAKRLEKVFAGSERTSMIHRQPKGVVNQPELTKRASAAEAKLNEMRSGIGTRLHAAITPTGATARPEVPLGARVHAGESGPRSIVHLPIPYRPETRALLPGWARFASDPRIGPLLAALGLSGSEEALGMKEQ